MYTEKVDLMKDFKKWLVNCNLQSESQAKQTVQQVTYVWKCLDERMSVNPNRFSDENNIEDWYFSPLLYKMKKNTTRSPEERVQVRIFLYHL